MRKECFISLCFALYLLQVLAENNDTNETSPSLSIHSFPRCVNASELFSSSGSFIFPQSYGRLKTCDEGQCKTHGEERFDARCLEMKAMFEQEQNKKEWSPLLSIILAGRNDHYGGGGLLSYEARLQNFLHTLDYYSALHNLTAELIFVEWNPPTNTTSLRNVVRWPQWPGIVTRFIVVPPEIHNMYPEPNRNILPVLEFVAKNVAARRAAGKYLLFTTSDIAWTSPLISFLANKLDETIGDLKAYVVGYRINFMWEGGALDPDRTLYQCINNSTELRMMGGPRNMSDPKARQETWDLMDNFAEEYQTTQVMQRTTPNSFVGGYHIQAPGDFTLLPKSKYEGIVIMFPYNQRFFDIRGYGEVPTYAHWDSILLFMAGAPEFRMQQLVLPPPIGFVCHQNHAGRPSSIGWKYVTRMSDAMNAVLRGTVVPQFQNGEDWGLGDEERSRLIEQHFWWSCDERREEWPQLLPVNR